MLPRVDSQVRPPPSVEAPNSAASVGETRQEVFSKLSQLVVGKQIQGEILSRLNDGTFVVRLDGATARMALPKDSKAGSSLPLTLVSTNPRPTFLLNSEEGATTTVALTRQELVESAQQNADTEGNASPLRGNLPASGQERTESVRANQIADAGALLNQIAPDEHASSAPTVLSNAGQLIDQILRAAQEKGAPGALVGKTPLADSAEAMAHTGTMAATLKQTLSSSGLFYESHVAEWADGKRPLNELMREPQAQMARALGNDANLDSASLVRNTELAQIVHLQLGTLEQQRIVWQGNLLPGQPMEWEVARNTAGKKGQQAEPEQSWQSTVRFELPHLGAIAATINLHGERLQIFVRTGSASSATALQEHAVTLAEALKQAGAQLDSFSVKKDDKT